MKAQDLKNSVLELAIQGKLVEQNPNDEPASILLEKIRAEKEELIKEKKIKREKPLPKISEGEKDFDLPLGWSWCRLSDITHSLTLNDGDWILSKDMSQDGEIKLIQLGSIGDGKYVNKGFKNISYNKFIELKCREINEGDILINRLLGKKMLACILPEIDGTKITSVDTCFIRPNPRIYNQKFILYMILSGYFQRKVYTKIAGTTRQRISKGNLINIVFPLPPLEEQKRIVAKIEEVLEKIEEYDKVERELTQLEKAFPQDMKKSILQYAIQGKLVEQNPNDEPASVLLWKIKAEKEQLIKEKKIKKEKPLPEISDEEKLFEIPEAWEWVRMGNVSEKIHYGYTASAKFEDTGVKMLRITDIQNNRVNWSNVPFCEIEKSKLEGSILSENDILIARTGGTIGKSFIVKNVEYTSVFASYLIRVIPCKNICPEYLKLFLESPLYWVQLKEKSQGTGQPNVNAVSLSNLIIPLPPLEEQKRIVDKVEKIEKYVNRLEDKMESKNLINKAIQIKSIDIADTKELIKN